MRLFLLAILASCFLLAGGLNEDLLKGVNYNLSKNYKKSNRILVDVLSRLDRAKHKKEMSKVYYLIGSNYYNLSNYLKARESFVEAMRLELSMHKESAFLANLYAFLGFCYERLTEHDNALKYLNKAEVLNNKYIDKADFYNAKIYVSYGDIYSYQMDYNKANKFYKKAIAIYNKYPSKVSREFLNSLKSRVKAIDER
jgi:tetratricopeptide (TPR) repeat protein